MELVYHSIVTKHVVVQILPPSLHSMHSANMNNKGMGEVMQKSSCGTCNSSTLNELGICGNYVAGLIKIDPG